MEHAVYATYLGTLVTLDSAIRRSNRSLARHTIRASLCLEGCERVAMLIAMDDASTGRRRSRHELVRAVVERLRSAQFVAAA